VLAVRPTEEDEASAGIAWAMGARPHILLYRPHEPHRAYTYVLYFVGLLGGVNLRRLSLGIKLKGARINTLIVVIV
jgi:hypothetical protein